MIEYYGHIIASIVTGATGLAYNQPSFIITGILWFVIAAVVSINESDLRSMNY